ncbi:MAG: 16S rRNA processing protein RimM [Bacilli bacterium]|nr:16S rRNA processing protein RimM [Bacilli bacterium]MBN2696129.1 16S rRNA processing protein RimM [Bacilli bacterium]
MDLIHIGKIVNTKGLKGEVKLLPDTDYKEERYLSSGKLYIVSEEKKIPVKIKSFSEHKGYDLVIFVGMEDINLVEQYKGCDLYAEKSEISHAENPNEFHINELIGLEVYVEGEQKGKIALIKTYPQGDYLDILKSDGSHALVPFRDEFVVNVDISSGKIEVIKMEGLL